MDRQSNRTRQPQRTRRVTALVALLATLAALLGAYGLTRPEAAREAAARTPSPSTPAGVQPTDDPGGDPPPLSFDAAPGARPARDTVAGVDGAPQPVGRITDDEGTAMDVVLGELVVSYGGAADLDGFLAAVGGEIIDTFDDEGEEVRDALVRIRPPSTPAPSEVAAALADHEPDLAGEWSLSHPELLPVLHATTTAPSYGLAAIPHGVYEHAGIPDGTTVDRDGVYGPDAFTWPYIASGTAQDIGVDTAWRLLADHGKLEETVKIMVVDQGFQQNGDFPAQRWIRKGEWDQPGWGGGSWHGMHVVMAGMAVVDNGVGGAGPAGPVARLIAVEGAGTSWTYTRSLRRLVDELRPAVVTMSFSRDVTVARLANQDFYERQFRRIKQDYGALPLASAGNDNRNIDSKKCSGCVERRLVMPCETKHVVCVGGFGEDTTARAVGGCGTAAGSNYGTRTGGRSVEIWGPYFTVTQGGGRACGTSMATPFVAGVAALVKAADPTLGPDGIWNLLKETAHDRGDVGAEVTGHQRRVNAGAAVARALGVQITAPSVRIDAPSAGTEIHHGEWVDLQATATDYRGKALGVTWTSSIDGTIGGPTKLPLGTDSLSPGEHTISVSATDGLGNSAGTGINLTVLDATPEVDILAPASGSTLALTQDLVLSGSAKDSRGYSVPDADVRWTIRRPGVQQPVASVTGAFATIPAGTLAPGFYELTLSATVAGATAADRVTFTVIVPQPGEEPPVITSPSNGSVVGAGTDNRATVRLTGYALDAQGEQVPGTRLRWTAESKQGTELVLCAGTHTPAGGGGPGTVQALTSCSDVEAELLLEGVGTTAWTITLEVYDGGTLRGQATTAVTVQLAVG